MCVYCVYLWIYKYTHIQYIFLQLFKCIFYIIYTHFVASDLDIDGCVLSYFEGTSLLHCYTSCTLTNLHCNKVSILQGCHMKISKTLCKMYSLYNSVKVLSPQNNSTQPLMSKLLATKMSSPLSENVQIRPNVSIFCVATIIFQHCLNPLGHGVHLSVTCCH